MSSTRHAAEGAPLKQERYSSSVEYERGLMANLVAKRCSLLEDPKDRELIWFLQFISHERGLRKFSAELIAANPGELATRSMLKFGTRGKYNAEQVRKVIAEIPPLRERESLARQGARARQLREMSEGLETTPAENSTEDSRDASAFVRECQSGGANLETFLTELCLDPARPIASPWYFANLITVLRDYMQEWQQQISERVVMTEVAQHVFSCLQYSLDGRCLSLAEGPARFGKTWSAKHWCLQRPGRARYVETPATDDDGGFYRAIAKAVGVSININSKARELRDRIDDALANGDLMLVFDEAHWLFGISTRATLPKRLLWVISSLVNRGISVAFVATPQFTKNQTFTREHTRWRDEQLNGRILHREPFPEILSDNDLKALIRAHLVAADVQDVRALVAFTRTSDGCLGSLAAVVKRAFFIAQRAGREVPDRADIHASIAERCRVSAPPAPAKVAERRGEPLPRGRSLAAEPPQLSVMRGTAPEQLEATA